MGKWFNHRVLKQHNFDLETKRDDLFIFYPHVIKVAQTFPRDSIAIGTLDFNDLIQAGHEGLIRAWDKVDWEKIDNAPNPQGQLWSFLKKRIKWSIRREIDKYGQHIATPINVLEKTRNKLGNQQLDKTLVNIFPRFFDNNISPMWSNDDPWISVQLEEMIVDQLEKVEKSVDNINMLLMFYGIGYDKFSLKDLSLKYNRSENAIKQIIFSTRKKLKTNEFEKMIENFYENQ